MFVRSIFFVLFMMNLLKMLVLFFDSRRDLLKVGLCVEFFFLGNNKIFIYYLLGFIYKI